MRHDAGGHWGVMGAQGADGLAGWNEHDIWVCEGGCRWIQGAEGGRRVDSGWCVLSVNRSSEWADSVRTNVMSV